MTKDPRTIEAFAYGVTKAILDKADEIMIRDANTTRIPRRGPGLFERMKQRFQRRRHE